MLNRGVLRTVFIPDTEEVTGSIPVSPTGSKTALDLRKRESGAVHIGVVQAPYGAPD